MHRGSSPTTDPNESGKLKKIPENSNSNVGAPMEIRSDSLNLFRLQTLQASHR